MRWPAAAILVGLVLLAQAAPSPAGDVDAVAPQRLDAAVPYGLGSSISLSQAAGLPPTIQDGLGPGSALQMGVDGIQTVCTAAFLVRDGWTGQYYLSTAGHCLVRDPADPTVVTGHTHPELVKNRVDVCVAGCINNGLDLGTYVELRAEGSYHPVAYAVSDGVGNDFGLIAIPDELHEQLRPALPQWGGPTGMSSGDAGDFVVHYGHGTLLVPGVGAVVTRTPADQGRVATLVFSDGSSFDAIGHVTGGDSGSGAALAVPSAEAFSGTDALGVVTHSVVYVGAPLMLGTSMEHGLSRASAFLLRPLSLVLADDPLPRAGAPPPAQAPGAAAVRILTPADSASIPAGTRQVRVAGNASLAAAGWPAGAQVQLAVDDVAFTAAGRIPVAGNVSWSAVWDLAGVPSGMHALRARVVDEAGTAVAHHNVTVFLEARKGSATAPSSGAGQGSNAPRPGTATASDEGDPEGTPVGGGSRPVPAGGAVAALALAFAAARGRRHGPGPSEPAPAP